MASKRRTAEDVFEMPDPVKKFIDQGLQTTHDQQNAQPTAVNPHDTLTESASSSRVVNMSHGRATHTGPREGKHQSALPPVQPPSAPLPVERAYARATVQKTIRFHPRLIAELDAYLRDQNLHEERPVSIQHVQNEALDLWLERNVRGRA